MEFLDIFYLSYDNGSRIPGARIAPVLIDELLQKRLFETKDLSSRTHTINMYNSNCHQAKEKVHLYMDKYFNGANLNLFIGGDHSITYFINSFLNINKNTEKLLVIFDAHIDQFLKGGDDFEVVNWNFLNYLEPFFSNVIIIGYRNFFPPDEYINNKKSTTVIDIDQIKLDFQTTMNEVTSYCQNREIYLSIDLDCLDPSVFPGVSYPIPGGLTFKELEYLLDVVFKNGTVKIIDIVEFNPQIEKDSSLTVIRELINRMAYKWFLK